MRGRNLNLIAFILICAAIAYHDMKDCHRLPWPPRFIAAGLTFFLMNVVALFDETLSGVMAIGFVIAVFVKDGFVGTCNEQPSTGQAHTTAFMGDSTSGYGITSVAEYQQAVNPQQNSGQSLR